LAVWLVAQADGSNGWGPLHEAVFRGDMNATRTIVQGHRCEIDAPSKAGVTPLIVAVKTRNLPMVRYLLEHGADVDQGDGRGITPLLYAISQHRIKIARLLLRYDADVNQPNDAGVTPLHQAAYRNDFAIVDLLLRAGADPDALNDAGVNACELAYLKGRYGMAEHLKSWTKGPCGRYADQLQKGETDHATDRKR
jgi:ankyrin repeat protein